MSLTTQQPTPGRPRADRAGARSSLSRSDEEAWRIMTSVYGRLVARLDSELQASHHITLRNYQVLVQLAEVEDGALRMAELAERLSVSPSGLTRRLDSLVREGLVKRQSCPADKRGTLAVLTFKGRDVLAEAGPTHSAGVRRYVFEPLTKEQVRNLNTTLRAIGATLSVKPPGPPEHKSATGAA